jgi:hypothetical protein
MLRRPRDASVQVEVSPEDDGSTTKWCREAIQG